MKEIKFKFWNKVFNKFVIPDDSIFVGALKDKDVVKLQYINLKDINEKEVYEADILKIRDVQFGYKYQGVINWDQESYSYQVAISKVYPTMPARKWYIPDLLNFHSIEIIGNLYQNPELLP